MRVLHLSTFHLSGGAGVAAARLNQALGRSGIESDVLVDHPSREESHVHTFRTGYLGRKLTWLRFSLERLYFLMFEKNKEVRFSFSPARIGADVSIHPLVRQADIIHLHWVNFGYLSTDGLANILRLGKQVVWTFHDMWPMTGGCHHSGTCDHYEHACGNCKFLRTSEENDLSHQVWQRKKDAFAAGQFSAVACSSWLGNRAQQSSLLTGFDIRSIPNPIDTTVFVPKDKRLARKALSLNPDKEYILFAAAKVKAPGKGYDFFRQAIERILQANRGLSKDFELIVFGQANPDLAADFSAKINFLGYLNDTEQITNAYCAASVFVTSSLEENLPNTIMEAMACGTPCVGFDVGGIPEMIDHLINGYVSDYKSIESLSTGIEWVLSHNSDGHLSAQARQKVVDNYSEEIVAAQYITLYKNLLKNQNPQSVQ
jgi:glycosyltransferase involved in cell wall biosynthesis